MFSFICCDPVTQPIWGTHHTEHHPERTWGIMNSLERRDKTEPNVNLYETEGSKFHSNITNDQRVKSKLTPSLFFQGHRNCL